VKQALSDGGKKVGLDVNPEKTMQMLMSRSQKIGQKHSIEQCTGPFKMRQS
jgi:hypothetical protein